MGTVYDEITLKNVGDVIDVRRGYIKESEVRETTLQVVADTGADTLVINEAVRQALELRITGSGSGDDCQTTDPVEVHWKDRSMICRPRLMPNAPEVLLGAIPLKDMDIMVDCNRQCLVGVHGDKQIGRAL
ncbi:hypothetical protein AGMMS49942_12070 [Spirochaetia bacterium]|nr:hypothetical protein AGMMS49942_12070 [Spirochaetia bacterium]